MKFLIFYRVKEGLTLWPQKLEKVLGGVKLFPYSEFQTDLLFLAFDLSLHPQRYLITLSLSHTFFVLVYIFYSLVVVLAGSRERVNVY